MCESRRTELLCQQSSFFHVLTATYVKLLPVAWVLDFGSSRAWLGIDRGPVAQLVEQRFAMREVGRS